MSIRNILILTPPKAAHPRLTTLFRTCILLTTASFILACTPQKNISLLPVIDDEISFNRNIPQIDTKSASIDFETATFSMG